jgi:hypothetical protein
MKGGSIIEGVAQDDRKLKYVIPEQTTEGSEIKPNPWKGKDIQT